MSEDRIICDCNGVSYIDIKKAMSEGARTLDEIMEVTSAATVCGGCMEEIEEVLSSVCGCNNVSLNSVVEAVNNGADTIDKVAEVTGTNASCCGCKPLVQNIIDTKK